MGYVIGRDGTRMTHKPGPRQGWSRDKGDGYCAMRSSAHGRRLGHLFASKSAISGVVTAHCSWCWKAKT